MNGLPPDIGVFGRIDAPTPEGLRDVVYLRLAAAGGELMRPLHLWEARSLAKALVSHACDPLTARAVCGLIGGAA